MSTLRVAVVAIVGILAPLVGELAASQLQWPKESGFVFAPRQDERSAILEAAARAGLIDPVRAKLAAPQFGCRGVALESARVYDGVRRSWRAAYVQDDTPIDECLAHKFRSGWRVVGDVDHMTEWLVERGTVDVWFTLQEYLTLDGRYHRISYEDARMVVLAFIENQVIDRRTIRRRIPEDPPLPVGPSAQQIVGVASRDGGWEVAADGWTFVVERRADRYVVTDSNFPIP
jgi:hypothetical protein